jgi:hypothetical protein
MGWRGAQSRHGWQGNITFPIRIYILYAYLHI